MPQRSRPTTELGAQVNGAAGEVVDQAIAGAFITEDIGGDVNVAAAAREVSSSLYDIATAIGVHDLGQKPEKSQACLTRALDRIGTALDTKPTSRVPWRVPWIFELPRRRMNRRSLLLPRQGSGCQRLLRLGLNLRQQPLEVCPAAEGVEVRLLDFAGDRPAGLDHSREGGDGLIGERSGLPWRLRLPSWHPLPFVIVEVDHGLRFLVGQPQDQVVVVGSAGQRVLFVLGKRLHLGGG
jgi:hypothetical protein